MWIHVSDWPKMPNMVTRPNLGDDSTFLHHGSFGWDILSFEPTMEYALAEWTVAGGEKMESPPRLGLETILGLLCQSLTWAHIPNYGSGVWVRLRKVLCIQDHLACRPASIMCCYAIFN